MLRVLRKVHLYLGLFTAPALMFFAFTGFLQTTGLHEATRGSNYKPAAWIVKLAQLHKKQTIDVPSAKPRPTESPKSDAPAAAVVSAPVQPAAPAATIAVDTSPKPPSNKQKNHYPMKFFFLIVSLGLFVSTLTGIYMAYKYNNSNLVVTLWLLAGIVIPLAILPL